MSPLRGRPVVVTGAARGVGAATAWELVRRGARVALVGREESTLAAVAERLGGRARYWEADVTDEATMARVAGEIAALMGPPSVVVANAGVAEGGPFLESDPATWRRTVEVNLIGSAVTARVFLPSLLETRGFLLQIGSLACFATSPLMSAYCASKAGVESLAHALRAEFAHRGVGVGIGYLNWTDTDMIRDGDHHAVLRELRGHMPWPARRVLPADVVATRLVHQIERRRPALYVPGWLRGVQAVRAALPAVVTRVSSRDLPRLIEEGELRPTGLLGAGGRAAREPGGPPAPAG
ncbi:SDR family oxidoreductase [Streptomyces pactum]|uniref:SDR family oxidoreductase n=1 Tax=Streptomyces pactum TaxID=68249 RepID=A0ABS0NSW0_9ACTN|nr:SDR family oxidoreductase [Streptomyces pactum]MBH5338310.1 SDR family oxidoreductase [Streptomyces pactum]